MVSYQDVPECDQSVLINETGPDAAGRAKPRPWRLGMGLTLVGAVCFMSYWSGLSIRGGAKRTLPQDRVSKLKRALLSLSETLPSKVEVTDHVSIHLGPTDGGEPDKMTVKLTLKPKEDAEDPEDADDAETTVFKWAFKYKDGMGEDMKQVLEDEIKSHAAEEERRLQEDDVNEEEDMNEMQQFAIPTVTLEEEEGLVYVEQKFTLTEEEKAQLQDVDLKDDAIAFEIAFGRDLSEMVAHQDESAAVVHEGIKAKVEIAMMKKVEIKMEEMASEEAEEYIPGGEMIGQALKLIRSFGLDASFKYSKTELSDVATSMGVPTFAMVLGILKEDLGGEDVIGFFKKLKDSADGLDHMSIKGLPKSPDYLLEFTNFHLTDFLLALAGEDGETEGEDGETEAEKSD